MDHRQQGLLKGLLAAVTFGLSAPLISTLSATGSPLALAGLLYGGSALALLTASAVRGQNTQESSVKRQDLGMLALLTLIGGIAAPICLVSGLALLSAGSASLLLNLEAVFTLGIAVLVGREHLSGKGIAAAALILLAGRVAKTSNPDILTTVSGVVVAGGISIHAMLHGLEAPKDSSTLFWWSGALLSSALVCGGTYLLQKKLPVTWTKAAAIAFLAIGGLLAFGPLGLLAGGAGA